MDLNSCLTGAAVFLCVALALIAPFRSRQKAASWFFSAGMLIFAAEGVLQAISLEAESTEMIEYWQSLALVVSSLLPGTWFCFSVTYSRGDYRTFFKKWRLLLFFGSLLPVVLATSFRPELFRILPYSEADPTLWLNFALPGKILNALFLLGTVLILMNLERTLRSAVGTVRWRVKFVVLGLGVIFGARIYTRSQALLYSGNELALGNVETGALLLGCLLMVTAYFRGAFIKIDVYPSRAVLHTSLTVLLVGGYLLVVGLLAQVIARLGGARSFQLQAFLLLIGVVGLSALLLSDKIRQRIQAFVSRHFKRPQHDFRRVWTLFAEGMAGPRDPSALCAAVARLLSETFGALSVSIWLADSQNDRLVIVASTSGAPRIDTDALAKPGAVGPSVETLQRLMRPFDLDALNDEWAVSLREIGAGRFSHGGHRICVPLRTGERWLGTAILADRVNGIPYSVEEMDLLECIGGQVGAGLLNLRLAAEMAAAKEFDAFQTISAFFVHDLKNAASTLSLMLTNLPVHFDELEFREDTLRGIGSTVKRINRLIARAGALKHSLELKPIELNLNALLTEAVQQVNGDAGPKWVKNLQPVPEFYADREQLQSVVMNLLLNAADAVGADGLVRVETSHRDGWAQFVVADNGCGMSPEFVQESLFRPFRTTKKEGLGIGMFQSKTIIEAHHGRIFVDSELGTGTTFRVSLPLNSWPR
jgi:putative PEP-CTERM system histidine kinase